MDKNIFSFLCRFSYLSLMLLGSFELHAEDLMKLSLEELMNVKVTSVSKTEKKLFDLGAAVYVIPEDELRRSGAVNVMDALRYVPGLNVARLDSNKWAVSARGFNGRFANKLLVLVDGRSVYTPLFSGVFWEIQDLPMEDIDRIEIIRGPGGSVWGANAVNGVINIITKNSKTTQGTLISAGYGTEEQGFGLFRFGDKIGDNGSYRLYGKYFNRDAGFHGHDDWRMGQGGFRSDFRIAPDSDLTIQGDYQDGELGQRAIAPTLTAPFSRTFDEDIVVSGGNLLSKWNHLLEDGSRIQLQAYFDRRIRHGILLAEDRNSFDFDVQHEFTVGEHQNWTWGFEHFLTSDETRPSFELALKPESRTSHVFSVFVQDEIVVVDDQLWITAGSKFEHNEFTGYEAQPNLRVVFKPEENHTLWTSFSRAVRTPSRIEHDGRINDSATAGAGGVPLLVSVFGDRHMESEELFAMEVGHRMKPLRRLTTDLALFFNQYDHLLTLEPGAPFVETSPTPTHVVVPLFASNKMSGSAYGVELSAKYELASWVNLSGTYSFLQMELHRGANSNDLTSESQEGRSPRHQANIRAQFDVARNVETDVGLRYVDELRAFNIPSYVTLDARIGYRPTRNLEISLVGQHLLNSPHPEFAPVSIETQATQVEYSLFGKVTYRY
jgi:iron complex outermembrane recepter protein